MEIFDPNAELTPDSPCPDWCAMHIDGCHVAELGEPSYVGKGHSVYVRPTDDGDGEVGLEVIVAAHDSLKTTRVVIPPDAVQEAAAQAAIQKALAEADEDDSEERGQ